MKKINIPFNRVDVQGKELEYINESILNAHISGDGKFTQKCNSILESELGVRKSLLTTSCTHALEMTAMLIDIKPGDEVIMPSYTFVSTANAFVLRGAKIIFIDIRPDTMNLDEDKIEKAINSKTKAIVAVHYAGVGCEMDKIMSIAEKHGIVVIEDAAQGVLSEYKGQALGSIGHIGTYSFHETKNITSGGEGGLLLLNDERFISDAEIIREKGTNRNQFLRGQIDKYTWVKMGSSFLSSELQAAYLWGQLNSAMKINKNRLEAWQFYHDALMPLKEKGNISLPQVPEDCKNNGHIYFLKLKDINERTSFINYLYKNQISSTFHYVPLHSSPGGRMFGTFVGEDKFTTLESERIVRLPIYHGITNDLQIKVIESIFNFFK